MARTNALIDGFNAGELSEKLAARISFEKYPLGCGTLINALPLVQGAFSRRPGTRYVAPVKDHAKSVTLIDFRFSTTQAYVIEAGEGYLRFFRNQGQIVIASTNAAISNGDFTTDISGWADRSTGAGAISHDAVGQRLALVPGGAGPTDVAWAEQGVTVSEANKTGEHVLRFRVDGAAGDTVTLRIGTATTGDEILGDTNFEVGYHAKAFTPGATSFFVQFRVAGETRDKTLHVDDVSLLAGGPVEIASPYQEGDLRAISYAQSADLLYLASQDYPVYKLARTSHTSWSLTEIAWADGPYLVENTGATTLVASAASGYGLTITASGVAGINDGAGFLGTDVGRLLRIKNGPNWAWGVIVGWIDATQVTLDQRGSTALPTVATDTWRLGAWSATTGHPAAISFFEQRLVLAGSRDRPQSFWMSQSADFENMAPDDGADTVEDDDALDFTIAAGQVNVIRWLAGGRELMLGTVGGEWLVSSDGPIITPSDIDVKRQSTHGSAALQPLEIGNVVLFLQAARRKLRELVFDLNVNGLKAPDLTILADHATESGVVQMAYQEEPQSTVWCVRSDGRLASLTYERNQDVVGWSRHGIGGTFGGDRALVEAITVVPGNDDPGQTLASDDRDEVWLVVKRTIDGSTRRYLEVLEGPFTAPRRDDYDSAAAWESAVLAVQGDAFYVDSGLTYQGVPTTTVSGLDHLEGETVAVLADGAVHPSRTVANGQISLAAPASKVQAGLQYAHVWRSLKVAAGARAGTAMGQTKRIHGLTLVLLDSLGGQVGPDEATLDDLVYREVGDAMDTAVPGFVGEKFAAFDGDWGSDGRIVVRGSDPAPFTVLAVIPELTTNDMV